MALWASSPATVASGGGAAFYLLVTLHVLAALTGFASTGFAGTYAARAGRLLGAGDNAPDGPAPPVQTGAGEENVEELQRYFARPARLWWALWAVPVFGAGAVSLQPDGHGFDQLWVLGALVVWAAALAVAGRLVVPSLAQLRELLAQAYSEPAAAAPGGAAPSPAARRLPEEAVARAARAGLVASRGAAVCDCLFFVALALMIWQPN